MPLACHKRVLRYAEMGEKTGWYYLSFSPDDIALLCPGRRQAFRVRGRLNQLTIRQQALIPVGDGHFIMALNADLRKKLGVRLGYEIDIHLEHDESEQQIAEDLRVCLDDEPAAAIFFNSLSRSHQMYFSRWIDSAKTEATRTKRIAMTVQAAARKLGYPEMIRENKKNRE